jgi:hypothetical protein
MPPPPTNWLKYIISKKLAGMFLFSVQCGAIALARRFRRAKSPFVILERGRLGRI